MKIGCALVLGFILVLVSVVCVSADDVQGETKANPVVDAKTHASAEVKNAEKEKPGEVEKKSSPAVKDGDRVDGDKKGAQNGSDASDQGLKKETRDADGGSSGKTHGKDTEQKEKKRVVPDPKEGTKIDEGSSGGSTTDLKKEKPLGEECDISNRCTDKENKLVACLRVPGNDAPGLSLLIQNKGKGTMVVKISVPKFVEVEKTSVEVKEKENQKVKVSFKKSGKGGDILLNTGTGHCSLDLKSLIANNNGGKEVVSLSKAKYLVFFTETKSLSFMFLALIVIIASVGVWISIRRRRRVATVSSYQKLDMELPISNAGQEIVNASGVNDGWDNGWDDNWDDEEAPMSPMPVTPSPSSKGLASRKLNKD
uniref:DUF7356 domain-containing protein n=1 Tax=Kalanchoe fedtschenkoi TaxID=63787 RepID=A0A7N0RDA0_KALFE